MNISGLEIPNYLSKKIEENSFHFGDTFQEIIETSISMQMQSVPKENIQSLNKIFRNLDIKHSALNESLTQMIEPEKGSANLNKRLSFWDNILESKNLTSSQINNIHKIKSLFEDDKQAIEGDGEDPNSDDIDGPDDQPTVDSTQGNPNPAENGSGDQGQDPNNDQETEEQQPQLDPAQVLQMELTQTNNKFMTLTLYDKINELLETIETILDNISSSKTEENLDFFNTLKMYQNYLYIISELIFVMDINTVYFNFTNISLEVNDLLDKYLISTKIKTLNDKKVSNYEKDDQGFNGNFRVQPVC